MNQISHPRELGQLHLLGSADARRRLAVTSDAIDVAAYRVLQQHSPIRQARFRAGIQKLPMIMV